MSTADFFQSIKPGIPKRYLLFLAAIVWTIAGGILLIKGTSIMIRHQTFSWLRVSICTAAGINLYLFLFAGISRKHVNRIIRIKYNLPCMFSFFNLLSYGIMAVMITSGIILRKSGIISLQNLSLIYLTMGIPLILSSIRFYYYGIRYHRISQPS